MRRENKATVGGAREQRHVVSIAWSLTETAFSLDLQRRSKLNRFDRLLGQELWTTHEFAEAILPRLQVL
jgi:hypothetical protein